MAVHALFTNISIIVTQRPVLTKIGNKITLEEQKEPRGPWSRTLGPEPLVQNPWSRTLGPEPLVQNPWSRTPGPEPLVQNPCPLALPQPLAPQYLECLRLGLVTVAGSLGRLLNW